MDVDKIDDGAMEFSLQSYLGEFWKDYRLNLSSFLDDVDPVFPTYLTNQIWVPDLIFDNVKNGMVFHLSLPNTNIKVLKDGAFLRSTRYNMLVGCMMDFRFYPMDTQDCYIKIALLANPDFKVLLHWVEELPTKMQSILLMNDIQPLQYELQVPKSYKSTEVWTSGNYTYLYANFTFVRRLSGSLFNVYVPSTLVVFLSWISFWLDIGAVPARVTLGVTSLLTLATQIVQAHAGLPPISYMTAMDIWLLACLVTVFSSILEFAFAYQTFAVNKQRVVNVNPRHTKTVMPKVDIPLSRLGQEEEIVLQGKSQSNNSSSSPDKYAKTTSDGIFLDKISRKLFPFSFILFSAIYWSCYLSFK